MTGRGWLLLWDNQAISQLKGDWEAARQFCDRGLAAWPGDSRFLGNRASLEYQVGNWSLGESYLHKLAEATRAAELEPNIEHAILATEIPFIGRITGSQKNPEMAEQAAERVLSSPFATPLAGLIARTGLGLLAVQREDSLAARHHYRDLETTLRGITFVELSGERVLGLLAQTMGDLYVAEDHFQEAMEFCRRVGCPPELGWSALDYARLLLRCNSPGDQAEALSLLEAARDIARRYHLRPLDEQVAAVQPQNRTLAGTLAIYPDGLTHREMEVLRLIALGKSNRQIAEDLFISLHTVIRHVSNILSKTGVANRAEAVTYALRRQLLQ
jgi:DNA-binding CsgD family transcriptional regulator